jgi:30S ribosomal protein S31
MQITGKRCPGQPERTGGIAIMGRGDKSTRKGKIWRGTHGNTRPRKKTTATVPVKGKAAKKK